MEMVVNLFDLREQVVSSTRKLPHAGAFKIYSGVPGLPERGKEPVKDIGALVHEDISRLPGVSSNSTAHCMNQHGLAVGCIFMEEELTI